MIIKIIINKQCINKLTIRSSDGKRELSHKKAIQYILHVDKHNLQIMFTSTWLTMHLACVASLV